MQNKSVRKILKESGCNCKNCKSSSIGYSKYYNGETLFCNITLDNCHDSTHGDYLCFDYTPKSKFMNISVTNLSHIGKWAVFTQEGMNYLLHGRIISIRDGCYCMKCKNSGYRYAMLDNIITITDSKQKCYSIKGEIKI